MNVPMVDRDLLDRLRADLRSSRYEIEHLAQVLGGVAVAALERENGLPALLAGRASDDPAAAAARLLTLGDTLTPEQAARALPTLGVEGGVELGLLVADETGVRSACDLRPVDIAGATWWLASDLDSSTTGVPVRPDHVLGVGGATRTLAELTVRVPVGRALDLGTGCGVQAMLLAAHAEEVIATDISPRALAYCDFNAALNQVSLQPRLGSMLEPVAGESFDLVVSNPPFVITPRTGELATYTYRDGGRRGDDLTAELITSLGSVLAPGGIAQMLGNWEIRTGEVWTARVGQWLDASGLDGWVVQREVLDPAHYVETWLRDGGHSAERDPRGWAEAATAWLADLAERDVVGIGFGHVVLRRPVDQAAPRLRRLEEADGQLVDGLGDRVAAALAAHDVLGADPAALLDLAPVVAGDVTEERHLLPGAADPTVILLRQGGGLARTTRVDTVLAAVVGACDGELTVGQIVAAVAALLEEDAAELRRRTLPALAELVLAGYLTLPSAGDGLHQKR